MRQVPLARVVVEQGDREVRAVGVAQHGGDDLLAAFAGAEHDDPGRALGVRAQLAFSEAAATT